MEAFETYYSALLQELRRIRCEVLRHRVEINLSLIEIVRLKNNLDNMVVYDSSFSESVPVAPSAEFKAVLSFNIKKLEAFNSDTCVRLADYGINLDLLRSDVVNAPYHYRNDFKDIDCFTKVRELTGQMDELCELISTILS